MSHRPQTRAQLAQISGVGARKLETYGDDFLEVLHEHGAEPPPKTDTVAESVQRLCLGMSVADIARERDLAATTVYGHLATAIERGELTLEDVITLVVADSRFFQYIWTVVIAPRSTSNVQPI